VVGSPNVNTRRRKNRACKTAPEGRTRWQSIRVKWNPLLFRRPAGRVKGTLSPALNREAEGVERDPAGNFNGPKTVPRFGGGDFTLLQVSQSWSWTKLRGKVTRALGKGTHNPLGRACVSQGSWNKGVETTSPPGTVFAGSMGV